MTSFPRALLLDMDGLLVDSEPTWLRAEADLARSLGASWTEADGAACVGVGLPGTVVRIAHAANVRADVQVLVQALIERFEARVGEVTEKPGARALIQAAKARGVPVAIATSSPRRLADRVLTAVGLLPEVHVMACGDEVEAPKPDPAVYLLGAERLGVPVDGALALEDSVTGCEAARRAGATVYAVPEGGFRGRGFEAWSDAIVGSLAEVQRRLGW